MQDERPRQGDAIAAPVRGWFDQEDGVFEGFGSWSWDRVDRCADRTDAGPAIKERSRHLELLRAAHLGHRCPTQDRVVAEPAETEQTDFTERPTWGCAVTRRRFPVGARPTRRFAPAGSNRSRHGGDEMSEAFG